MFMQVKALRFAAPGRAPEVEDAIVNVDQIERILPAYAPGPDPCFAISFRDGGELRCRGSIGDVMAELAKVPDRARAGG